MRFSINKVAIQGSFFITVLLTIIASPFSLAKDTDRSQKSCAYDEKSMLELSPREFDQNFEKGWPALVENGDCLEVAADLIHTYYTQNEISAGALRTLSWHEGQLRAEVGQYQQAIDLMIQAKKLPEQDLSGWNYYVGATIAFLQSDREKLKTYRKKLAAVPKPQGFNPKDANGNPIDIPWPPNLTVVDKFIRCFGQSYADVYAGCTKEK